MQNLIKYFFLFSTLIFILSCNKKPEALFTTDKDTYRAGETVHCRDVSVNAYSWKWTAPDGKTYNTENLDWAIDSNDLGGTKTFSLEVTSKNGHKTATNSKTINVKQYILPTDYFAVGTYSYTPISKYAAANSGKYWVVEADDGSQSTCYNALQLNFWGTTPPVAGNYSCQSTNPTATGQVYVQIGAPTGIECAGVQWFVSTTGTLSVSITSSNKVRVQFNNIPTATIYSISGDITCH